MKDISLIKNEKNIRKIYLGIEILRMILSFLIVDVHFFNFRNTKNK